MNGNVSIGTTLIHECFYCIFYCFSFTNIHRVKFPKVVRGMKLFQWHLSLMEYKCIEGSSLQGTRPEVSQL